jgi:hypothetical protein
MDPRCSDVIKDGQHFALSVSMAETRAPRLLFIDNLRWTMIILVISMHGADTYSPLGKWYFVDRTRLPIPELLTFAAWQMYLQSFSWACCSSSQESLSLLRLIGRAPADSLKIERSG